MRKGANSSIKTVSEALNLSQLRFHQIKDKEITKVCDHTQSFTICILMSWAILYQTTDKGLFHAFHFGRLVVLIKWKETALL